jgi:hypothetical protein
MPLIICDCYICTVIAKFTATKHLLEYVNCLSHGGGQPARLVLKGWGGGDIASLPDQLTFSLGAVFSRCSEFKGPKNLYIFEVSDT